MYFCGLFYVILIIDFFIMNLFFYCVFNFVVLFDNFILLWVFKNLFSYIFKMIGLKV